MQVFYRTHVATIKHLLRNESQILSLPTSSLMSDSQKESPKAAELSEGRLTETAADVSEKTKTVTHLQPTEVKKNDQQECSDLKADQLITAPTSAETCAESDATPMECAAVTSLATGAEVAEDVNNDDDEFHLKVFWRYVDESFSTPFALSQEKDKPKLKINERSVRVYMTFLCIGSTC